MKVVAVAGPDEREATSTVTANLAVSLAAGGASVVAVCCDLRRPRLHLFFRRSDESGLCDVPRTALPENQARGHPSGAPRQRQFRRLRRDREMTFEFL